MENFEINFGNIPPDLEPDENIILWRYMSFSSLCEMLMNDHIPLISIRNFSDKSEGAILGAILKEILPKSPYVFHNVIEYVMQTYYETTYVSSWHKAKNENAAMWDRYTYKGEGVAVKTNAKLLFNCIEAIKNNQITDHQSFSELRLDALPEGSSVIPNIIIKEVEYTDKNPTDFAMAAKYLHNGYDLLCFFYKLGDFRDEAEIRILRSTFQSADILTAFLGIDFSFRKIDDALKKVSFPQNSLRLNIDSAGKLIQKIVVSPYAHNEFIKTLRQSIEVINQHRENLQVDLIECNIIESRRKVWV